MKLDELACYLKGDLDDVGMIPKDKTSAVNTHKYKPNEKYVHFFKNIKDLVSIQYYQGFSSNSCVAKFNIPVSKLVMGTGRGFYLDETTHGYDELCNTIIEFAIPSKKLESEYLIDFVEDCYLDKNNNKIVLSSEQVAKKFKENVNNIQKFEIEKI